MEWETIRASYVNGQFSQAKEQLYQLSKYKMLKVVLEAVNQSFALKHESGDLQDLREIITKILKGA